ncbi:low molecular weight phosphotyrosine protein phosphatase [Paeniglutamicibacter sp. ABSL32-1]|uniref:low molecular weight protein-tyrosine-phosphatase n=1 Tax=Paeniglutamicibacter quisquiliarum TaxID=2849498 RepID=UPI001C2DA541|nr:low molecular weight protein-tyrosine-phosphatase [Paeniglutamicibacter quisquiliarum]MBV1780621.1 low molecular weight phosphotyrosine protein phosphatase [Paeniglutamicibacter quisquiliarum]
MFRILTVCTGNICRSPMAEYMIRTALGDAGILDVLVESAGTSDGEAGHGIDPRAAAILQSHGINAEEHVARVLDADMVTGADLLLAMDQEHLAALAKMLPADPSAPRPDLRMMRSFDTTLASAPVEGQGIYDPWFGDSADFRLCWQMVNAAIPGVLDYVRAHTMPQRGN